MEKERFLTVRDVVDLTTFSRTTLHRKVRAGEFPAPIALSERRRVFSESAVRQWMAEREAA